MRALLAGLAFFAVSLPAVAPAAPVSLKELSDYMTGLQSAQTTFTQMNGDGSVSTGLFQLKRPGKMRFEYDPPDQALVVAGANSVAIIDKKLRTAEQYPLRRTPLKLILSRQVDLSKSGMVVDHYEQDGFTVVTTRDPQNPEYGTLDLVFSTDPLALVQWRVRDETGGETLVMLDTFERDVDLPFALFNLAELLADYQN